MQKGNLYRVLIMAKDNYIYFTRAKARLFKEVLLDFVEKEKQYLTSDELRYGYCEKTSEIGKRLVWSVDLINKMEDIINED